MSTRVLVVEDDHGQREALSQMLSGDAAHDIARKARRTSKTEDFLPKPLSAASSGSGRWPFLRDNSPAASNLIAVQHRVKA